ncbi:PAS domain S-box protein, partial [Candidatus Nomurabacteria bacterium]|nr:PAS domain S-box protein [Candidatus Nomurabacteria bacterium]
MNDADSDMASRILRALRARPKGMTITDVAKQVGATRNSVSKHLEILQISGKVESVTIGNAKLFSTANRIPLSGFLCFTHSMILVLDSNHNIINVNNRFLEHLNLKREDIIGLNLIESDVPLLSSEERIAEIAALKKERVRSEIINKRDGEDYYYTMDVIRTLFEDGEKGTTILLDDVTERKRWEIALKKSEEKYRTIADFTYDWEFWIGADGQMKYVSPSCEDISGYTASEFMEKAGLLSEIVFPEDSDSPCLNYGSVFESPVANETEFRITARDGEVRWIAHVCRSVYDKEGRFIGRRGSNRDITEKKKSEMEIQNLLEQKEMLLREVHHRIKNNMNTVAGLLKLQSMSIEEPAAIEALNDARGRVQNMMLIYDRLYRSADYKNLNVRDYFENLLNEIIKLFPNHSKVNVVKKIDDFNLDSKVLFTMGIMINELITNTFKYAFDETDNPELAFSLSFNDGRISFAVKDNGPGLPDNVKSGNRNG